jgi:membrane fusion protein
LKQTAARERLAVLAKELVQWETQARWLQQRLGLAQQAQERLRQLREQQFASEAQEQAQAETVLGLRADLAAIERQRQALLREQRELEAELRQAPLQTAQQVGEFERSRDELREQSLRADAAWLGQQPVLAPLAAQVSHLPVSVGQSVNQGNVLAWLTPQGAQLQALLYAPSRAIGLLRAGQEVRLRVQAFAYQRYGWLRGRIQRVAQAPARDDELWPVATSPDAAREPLYRVTVTLERQTMSNPAGGTLPLRTGMLLDADVLLERRTLFAWAFESLPMGR